MPACADLTGPARAIAIGQCTRFLASHDARTMTRSSSDVPLFTRLTAFCAQHVPCTEEVVRIAWHFQTQACRAHWLTQLMLHPEGATHA